MKRIGILGGTFSPIHVGHLMLAQGALDEYALDEILIMPNGNPPHKVNNHVLSGEHRRNMVSLAIQEQPKFTLYEYELGLQEPGYTSETLCHIHEEYPDAELYFIMGADSLDYLEQWHEPEEICALAHILVAPRDIMGIPTIMEKAKGLTESLGARIEILHLPALDISSTWIREAVSKGYHVRYYTTKAVEAYIEEQGLYKE